MWILLPALIALRTWRGASAGGIAVPSGCIWAVPLGDVVVVVVVVVLPGGPAPPVCAAAGMAAISETANSSPAMLSVLDRKPFSFVGLRG